MIQDHRNKFWITNGAENKFHYENLEMPDGYTKGRTMKKRKSK